MEIKKRRDVQMVNTLVAVFVPVRNSVCSACPLVDAALYQGKRKGDSLDRNRFEVVMEDNPISVLALEPHHVDSILDDRVLIWISSPVNVGFMVDESHIGQERVRQSCIAI